MKIRIVLADTDEKYINHFIRAFKIYYFNEVDIVTFSDSVALKIIFQAEHMIFCFQLRPCSLKRRREKV